MKAIEFMTTLHNGSVAVPPQYSWQWEGKIIRVIFLEVADPSEANISQGSGTVAADQASSAD